MDLKKQADRILTAHICRNFYLMGAYTYSVYHIHIVTPGIEYHMPAVIDEIEWLYTLQEQTVNHYDLISQEKDSNAA